ncbi:MAG: SpvB/TcaC N-terminal domain-containing protein [Nitrospirota bacterium]
MKLRLVACLCFVLAFIPFPFPFYISHAQEVVVPSGAKVTDPTNTGAAAVSIPIEVPPGRNGIAPNIVLSYNSNLANGWVGVGWDLEMGEIQRSTKRGVDYSANEYIFLSSGTSSELVARADWGSNYYGSKIEGAFSKYFYNSATGGWEVTTKDGTKYYYGSSAASRQDFVINGVTVVFKWCLDKVQDLNGNYMTVTYFKDQGEIYLEQINYTGNVKGLSPAAYVKFIRESRTDAPPMYTTNALVKMAYRLKTIEVHYVLEGVDSLVRRYSLNYTYSPDSYRSTLTSVTQYGSDGVSALPSTTFGWQTGGNGWTSITGLSTFSPAQGYSNENTYPIFTGDFNGDGKTDVGRVHSSGVSVYVANGSGGWTMLNDLADFSPAQGYSNANTYPLYLSKSAKVLSQVSSS